MTMPLFLDNVYKLTFEKVGMPVKLSDSPDAWQREIASEIFKQIPYLGNYAVNVVVDRVEAERGFAFGSAQVTNKSDAPIPDQKKLPSVRIPLIVKERMLAPLDVFMDEDGVYPLTEKRLNEKLFRTATFEASTRKPSDKGLTDQLYPPTRGGNSMSGDTSTLGKFAGDAEAVSDYDRKIGKVRKKVMELRDTVKDNWTKKAGDAEAGRQAYIRQMKSEAASNPFGKSSSLEDETKAPLIESIAETIPEVEADEFVDQIVGNDALAYATAHNKTFSKLAMFVAGYSRLSHEKRAEAIVGSIKPTVVQFKKLASGDFLFKWANADAFAPQEGVVDPQQAAAMTGADLGGVATGTTVTVGIEKAKKQHLKEEGFIQIKEPGIYKVQNTETNEEMVGQVLPIVDFEQQPLELFLFSNEAGYSVQDMMVGIRQEGAPTALPMVPMQQAQGDGVPVYDIDGKLFALLPMTVQNSAQTPGGVQQIHGETVFGEPIILTPSAGLETIQKMSDTEYAVPDYVQWHAFPGPPMMLAKEPAEVKNLGQAQQAPSTVAVGSTGPGEFSMEGQPLDKVAKDQKQFIKQAQAEFLLVAMGVSPFDARTVLSVAEQKGFTKLAGLKPITPLSSRHVDMIKRAAKNMSPLAYNLRQNLVKEAAVLEDGDTADKVLSLNFLNPENLNTFASYLPELDSASQKLAETLVASRLGMSQVDEGALERSMRGMESVIEGLKTLQQGEVGA